MLWLLQRQLGSRDVTVRRRAMGELSKAPTVRLLPTLRKALVDADPEVRQLAVLAIGKLEDAQKIEPLLGALRDREAEVIKQAIISLKRTNDPKIVAAIAPLIRHGDAGVRGHASLMLEASGWKPASQDDEIWYAVSRNQFLRAAKIGPAAVAALESVLAGGPYNFRVAAVEALGKINDERAVRPLLAGLRSQDSAVCVAVIDVLTKRGEAQATPGIIALLKHRESPVRVAATDALGKMGAKDAIVPLRELLRDTAWDVRRSAADALAKLKDTESVELIAHNLDDSDADVRETTALALGNLKDRRAIGPLVKTLKDSASGVRRIAAAALSRIDENWSSSAEALVAIEQLKTSLADKDPEVRYLVNRLLVSLGQAPAEKDDLPAGDATAMSTPEKRRKLAVSIFTLLLADGDRDFRQAAAEGIGRLGDQRDQAVLKKAVADADGAVRFAAQVALKAVSARAPA